MDACQRIVTQIIRLECRMSCCNCNQITHATPPQLQSENHGNLDSRSFASEDCPFIKCMSCKLMLDSGRCIGCHRGRRDGVSADVRFHCCRARLCRKTCHAYSAPMELLRRGIRDRRANNHHRQLLSLDNQESGIS